MPQARLPDINTQYIKFTNEAVNSWKSKSYESCLGSLFALNGMLPADYRVTISDQDYLDKTKEVLIVVCTDCKKETDRDEVAVRHLMLPHLDSILAGQKYDDFWFCPKCNIRNKLSKTEMILNKRVDPAFNQVMPKPPTRHDGLLDRAKYHSKFTLWFWTCMGEIIAQMAKFRDDNWTKENIYGNDDDVNTEAEESDQN